MPAADTNDKHDDVPSWNDESAKYDQPVGHAAFCPPLPDDADDDGDADAAALVDADTDAAALVDAATAALTDELADTDTVSDELGVTLGVTNPTSSWQM